MPRQPPRSADEIEVFTSPWIQHTRAVAYYGPIEVTVFVAADEGVNRTDQWLKAINEMVDQLKLKAFTLTANTVVGCEISADPFTGDGLTLHMVGTAAELQPVWDSSDDR